MASLNIENLPAEILVEIFRLLDMKTRIKSLSVNQRWRCWMPFADRLGCLHVDKLFPRRWGQLGLLRVEKTAVTAALRDMLILPQIGPRLKSMVFGHVELAAVHLDLIAQFCPVLSCIDLLGVGVSEPNDFNFVAIQQMSNLRSLRVGGHRNQNWLENWSEADQARFLLNLSNLFGVLEDLKEFHLASLPFPPAFVAPNLTNLSICRSESFTDDQLAAICRISTNLITLSLDELNPARDFTPIERLSKLAKLRLIDTFVDEDQMEVITRSCTQLCSIDVSNVQLDSQIARINWLRHLPNLKSLAINLANTKVTDIPRNWAIQELSIELNGSEANLLKLSEKSPLVKRLRLNNGSLSDDVVTKLSNRWEMLEELHLFHLKISDESRAQLALRENLRLLDLHEWLSESSAYFIRLLVTKRQQLQISTPLNIRLGRRNRKEFSPQLINQLNEELRDVRVRLIGDFCDD